MNILKYLEYLDFLNSRKKAIYIVSGLALLFLLLTAFVALLPTTFIDLEFSEELQEDHSPLLDMLMKFVSWFGTRWVAISMAVGTALAFLLMRFRREALFMMLTMLSSVVAFGIKVLVNRPRPTEDLVRIVSKAENQSFPSGHTTFYVAFFGFLIFLLFRLRQIPSLIRWTVGSFSLLLILSVPFSRVYLGDHWFTDVVAGFVLGLISLVLLIYGYFRPERRASAGQ
ncbi:phosphatase PAP2 family protein [Persicitalea jodogahamensis]|nr:phosphatase PAP2 family protein [Persicitalea jodogahamensis]